MTARTPRLVWSAVSIGVATGALIAVAIAAPGIIPGALFAYVILVASIVARLLVRTVVSTTESQEARAPFDVGLRPRPLAADDVADVRQISAELRSSAHIASTLHHQLRPRLRAIAEDRLAADHGVALDRDPDASRRVLGDEAWQLLRADREPPSRRDGGISTADLERIVSALEKL